MSLMKGKMMEKLMGSARRMRMRMVMGRRGMGVSLGAGGGSMGEVSGSSLWARWVAAVPFENLLEGDMMGD